MIHVKSQIKKLKISPALMLSSISNTYFACILDILLEYKNNR